MKGRILKTLSSSVTTVVLLLLYAAGLAVATFVEKYQGTPLARSLASNRQQQAKNEALQLQQQMEPLLNMPIYALSEPPFWKVRVGNFKTREEANAYKDIFLNAFPHMSGSTYVVPDKIILVQ